MSRPVFLGAHWRHLALLNYEIDPRILAPHVPMGTELDFLDGKTYVSLVAFLFERTTIGEHIPALFHRDFEEVNLRFYVVRKTPQEIKRGVVFIKEIVPKPFLAWVARTFYSENYVSMPMSHTIQPGRRYEYRWGPHSLEIETESELLECGPDSPERWITEHYWGYTKIDPKRTFEYEVKHPVWNLYRVKSHTLRVNAAELYGEEFSSILAKRPVSVFLAHGSGITVHWPKRILG